MSALTPGQAELLDRITSPVSRLLDRIQEQADNLGAILVNVTITDEEGTDLGAWELASEHEDTIAELRRLLD